MGADDATQTGEDEVVGYVQLVETEKWQYAKRFKVFVSTPTPDKVTENLRAWMGGLAEPQSTLAELLTAFLDVQKVQDTDAEHWLMYDVEESEAPANDFIFQAINGVREKAGSPPLVWSHFRLFVASNDAGTTSEMIEHTIEFWIEKAMDPKPDGEERTWVKAIPIQLLPGESVKKGKRIPIKLGDITRIIDRRRETKEQSAPEPGKSPGK